MLAQQDDPIAPDAGPESEAPAYMQESLDASWSN